MTMILYGRILSPYLARCVIAANAKGVRVEVRLPPSSIKAAPYLKMNPLGLMPVLKDGKTVIYESAAIVDYIDSKSRKNPLAPKTAKGVLQTRLPAAIANEYVQSHGVDLFRLKRGTSAKPVDPAVSGPALVKGLDVLEQVLAKGKFAGGAKISVADCFIPPALVFAARVASLFGLGDIFAGRPKLAKYWKGIRKHPAVKPVVDGMNAMMDEALAGRLPPLH